MSQYNNRAGVTAAVRRTNLLDHPIFSVACTRPLSKDEVEVYMSIKAQIKALDEPTPSPGPAETLGAFDF